MDHCQVNKLVYKLHIGKHDDHNFLKMSKVKGDIICSWLYV